MKSAAQDPHCFYQHDEAIYINNEVAPMIYWEILVHIM